MDVPSFGQGDTKEMVPKTEQALPSAGALTARYRVIRELGRGGMGAVLLVHDEARGEDVALKRVLDTGGSALIRFKREFRVIEGLLHPSLVRLLELGEDADGLYFTMEAVDGKDLAAYCGDSLEHPLPQKESTHPARESEVRTGTGPRAARPTLAPDPPPPIRTSLDALLHTTPQILEALAFLHAHGVVHRDLKPSNVLVTDEGVAKLLDYGVLATLTEALTPDQEGFVVGTVGFMAPEQYSEALPTPAMDLYGLGATLFSLIASRPIFRVSSVPQAMVRFLRKDAPRLDTIVQGLAPSLVDLVARLLARDPEARPDLQEVGVALEALGARPSVLTPPRPRVVRALGRGELVEELAAACMRALQGEASPRQILSGPIGAGKTTVTEAVARRLARDGVLVLRGRGRTSERLAFNGLDSAIDELAMCLARERTLPESVVAHASVVATAFPVLRPLAVVAEGASLGEVARALTALLAHAGDEHGVLLVVDDLQWADADTLQLLAEMDRTNTAPLGRVALLATVRDDLPTAALERWLLEVGAQRHVLGDLGREALEAIVHEAAGFEVEAEPLAQALAHAAGRPFLAESAGRALGRGRGGFGLEPLVQCALERDTPLLAALFAADDWSTATDLAVHLECTPGEVADRVQDLSTDGAVRCAGEGGPRAIVDIYHDSVRTLLAAALPPEAQTHAHTRFAALIADGGLAEASSARRVRHLLGAGLNAEAGRAALEAAEVAEAQLAFGLAAELLGVASANGAGDVEALTRRQAELLERVARYQEALPLWTRLEASPDPTLRLEAALRSASALFGANRVEEGAQHLEQAVIAGGGKVLGRTGIAELWAGLRFLRGPARVRARPGAADGVPQARAKRKLALMLGLFDPLQGVRLLVEARKAFGRAGEHAGVVECDAYLAFFADFGSVGPDVPTLAERYYRSARERCDREGLTSRRVDGVRRYLDGMAHLRRARWDQAWEDVGGALELFQGLGEEGGIEHTWGITTLATICTCRQDLAGLESLLGQYRDIERRGGDLTLASHAQLLTLLNLSYRGRWSEARELRERAWAALPTNVPTIQRPLLIHVGALLEIYDGDLREALAKQLTIGDPIARRFRLYRSQVGPIHASIAALVEVLALRAGASEASPHRIRRRVRQIERNPTLAGGRAERVRAYLADARGHPEEAIAWLERSEAAAEDVGRAVAQGIARAQRGLRLGGDEGARLVSEGQVLLESVGASPDLLLEDPTYR